MADPLLVLGAALVEGLVGYPDRLHRRLPHPVAWLGAGVGWCERRWNDPARPERIRRLLGVLTVLLVAGGAALVGGLLHHLLGESYLGVLVLMILGSLGLAARSLYDHVAAVAKAADLDAARAAVGRIVGRDTDRLDESGVAAAALESLAESFCDGVVAPVFWFLLGGLGGLFAYKAVNTADSLIGHREERWRAFGWFAARTDDLMNWIPARIAGALVALAAGGGWTTMFRDARKHASPNAGWPEAAMAGGLRVRLGGPATYDGVAHDRPVFGDGPAPTTADLKRGLGVYLRACAILAAMLLVGGLTWPR
ncbi:adenosylcobinamide-phosphate synthase CbiB [Caulobacter segnis]|uniref:adenosylcobinamide-phosphate synthase CbiB n=1 Tax=Caulobacter segnis TaxID=88688 RepID=UPI0024100E5A|nr:adenosylcobinamide-phosphate synthase CbiB [Caulobacter segnis]MDG2521847.1 adenosylcobinamide-phosphate synthase CbiB [Caulobacter segnis]